VINRLNDQDLEKVDEMLQSNDEALEEQPIEAEGEDVLSHEGDFAEENKDEDDESKAPSKVTSAFSMRTDSTREVISRLEDQLQGERK